MTQPALFAAPTRAPHPGSACCDPTQDLPGWIRAQRARIARDWRWSRIWRARGNRLDRASLRAYATGDYTTGRTHQLASIAAHGHANAHAQTALIRTGDTDRVEAAHQWRLT